MNPDNSTGGGNPNGQILGQPQGPQIVSSQTPVYQPPAAQPPTYQPQPTSPPNYAPSESKGKNMLLWIIIGILALILVGGGGFLVAGMINSPAKVKEKVEVVQPVFTDYAASLQKIADHVKEASSGSDADALVRDAQKSDGLVKSAQQDAKTLTPLVEKLDTKELADYQKAIKAYMVKADELVAQELENGKLSSSYVSPLKEYQDLSVKVSGISVYMYSDPDKYIKSVNDAIDKEEGIIKSFEAIDPGKTFQQQHQAFIKSLRTEVDFLKQIKTAVEKRSTEQIAAAQKAYAAGLQADHKELSRLSDKNKEQNDTILSDLTSLKGKVESEYSKLKSTYKF